VGIIILVVYILVYSSIKLLFLTQDNIKFCGDQNNSPLIDGHNLNLDILEHYQDLELNQIIKS